MNKIFGLGLSKTGTSSLNKALNILGFKSIHYPSDETTFRELISGKYHLTLLNQYYAITDITTIPFFKFFDILYPDSKFILTIRDKTEWLDSTEYFWNNVLINGTWNNIVDNYLNYDIPYSMKYDTRIYIKITLFLHSNVFKSYKYSRDAFSAAFDEHLQNITNYFQGRNNLLTLDVFDGEGWEKICPFLKVPIPEQPFPHENKRCTK